MDGKVSVESILADFHQTQIDFVGQLSSFFWSNTFFQLSVGFSLNSSKFSVQLNPVCLKFTALRKNHRAEVKCYLFTNLQNEKYYVWKKYRILYLSKNIYFPSLIFWDRMIIRGVHRPDENFCLSNFKLCDVEENSRMEILFFRFVKQKDRSCCNQWRSQAESVVALVPATKIWL